MKKIEIKVMFWKKSRTQKTITAFIFIIPIMILFGIFRIYPILYSIYISFFDWNLLSSVKPFIGLGNYFVIFKDSVFLIALGNTLIYVIATVPFVFVISLSLALLFNNKIKFLGLFRAIYFLPVITSLVAVAMVWKWIYQPGFGLQIGRAHV